MQMGKTEPQAIKLTEDQNTQAFLDDFEVEDDMELWPEFPAEPGILLVGEILKIPVSDWQIYNSSIQTRNQTVYNWASDKSKVEETEEMDFKNLLPATNRDELRQWLSENHNKEDECWVVVKRGRPVDNGTFWYIDAVEEAMCFGWIDSTTKKMDNGITAQRLAPRRKGSVLVWIKQRNVAGEWNG